MDVTPAPFRFGLAPALRGCVHPVQAVNWTVVVSDVFGSPKGLAGQHSGPGDPYDKAVTAAYHNAGFHSELERRAIFRGEVGVQVWTYRYG